jgi:hypothetical protein
VSSIDIYCDVLLEEYLLDVLVYVFGILVYVHVEYIGETYLVYIGT